MKYIHTFESFLNEDTLNYTQAMELGVLSDVVKNHIKTNYYELYYGGPNNILGTFGKDIPGTSWKKLEKLAKDTSDKDLEIAITNYKDLAKKYKVKAFESLSENKDEIIFSVDDEKLDQILHAKFKSQLDYEDIKGDSYYALPKREFDRFIDLADSSGFDVDYDGSETSVVYVHESLKEKMVYPEGGNTTSDTILDKLAKLLNSGSSTIEITNNQVRAVNLAFSFSPASTFFVANRDGYYLMNTIKGFFRVDKKDITKAEDLYDELESIIQAGKTKRPSSRETDMFGKK